MTSKEAKKHFKGICPYTNKPCKVWLCKLCRVEHRERKYAKGGRL